MLYNTSPAVPRHAHDCGEESTVYSAPAHKQIIISLVAAAQNQVIRARNRGSRVRGKPTVS